MPLKGPVIDFEMLKDAFNDPPYYRHPNTRLVEFSEKG